ncbi:MAG: hypothetical protein LBQ93_04350 [Treponema sp.]|jgi:Gpi18-like mannosyltransferase|nr:hypothetical protein [Treponema sp.]
MHYNNYPEGNIQKTKISHANLALGFLCLLCGIICLVIIISPYIRQMLLSFAKSNIPRETTNAEESILKRMFIFLPVTGLILSIIVGILILSEKSIIATMTRNIIIVSYFTVTLVAIVIRLPGIQFSSGDYETFIKPWTSFLAANNHLFGINSIKSDYTHFYLFILSLISFLPESIWLISVKLVSSLFDFFLAIICGKIVLSISYKKENALAAYSAILLCPTVFINSSIWAQCDSSIYVTFMFLSLLLFIKGKNNLALFIYGIALTIKLQAIFMFPFIIILYLYNKYKIGDIIFLFLGFISTLIIGLPFGAPKQFLKAFFKQLTSYDGALTHNAPSVYALFNIRNESIPIIQNIGIMFTLGVLVCFILYILFINSKYPDIGCFNVPFEGGGGYVIIFFFLTLVIPFLLPKMHERYFFAAEVASIVFAVLFPRKWWITLVVILPACATYFNFLFANTANLFPLAIIMLFGILFVTKWTIDNIGKRRNYSS